MKKYLLCLSILTGISWATMAQNQVNKNGPAVFYHPNGKISSEGTMRDGKPDGYWKTYSEEGIIKSEGNRKNFELDSIWKFYDETGKLILDIHYRNGKKNGIKTTYREKETIAENFVDDIKQGLTTYYYPDGKVHKTVNFINGLENGISKEFSPDGTVITFIEYRKGFIVSRESINRRDKNGLKQGRWKFFFDNGIVRMEGSYKDDKKNGYFKDYNEEGNLLTVSKFVDDIKQEDAPELASLDIRTDYYPSGKIKTVASYKGETPEGVRREYAENGTIVAGYIFTKGAITGQGIIDEEGIKDGPWKELYLEGNLRSEGSYDKGKKIGAWKFYYPDGKIEQEGNYNKQGNLDGTWRWYYDTGNLWREQSYINGLEEGLYTEYDENNKLITTGEFIEGMEEGEWTYDLGDHKEVGTYRSGMRNGKWKYSYPDGVLSFEGSFIDDNANGKQIWYWPNGKVQEAGDFIMGERDGDWANYNEDGTPFLVTTYKNGIEKKYDGVVVKPPFEE